MRDQHLEMHHMVHEPASRHASIQAVGPEVHNAESTFSKVQQLLIQSLTCPCQAVHVQLANIALQWLTSANVVQSSTTSVLLSCVVSCRIKSWHGAQPRCSS
jgi:hypothetical protein